MNLFFKYRIISKSTKILIKNFSFLSILQASQLFIGFLLFPYLIKVLGTELYGVVAFGQTIVAFLIIILNYGFNITGTKQVAIHKNDRDEVNRIIITIYTTKFLLLLLIAIIYFTIIFSFDFFSPYLLIYVYSFFVLLGWFFFPQWYFQGVQKMESITYVMLMAKISALVLIFIFVKSQERFFLVPIINSVTMLIAGSLGFYLLKKDFRDLKLFFAIDSIKKSFSEGWTIFLSNISSNAKEYVSSILIGTYLDYSSYAIYDISSRIVKVLTIPITILIKTIFPQFTIKRSRKFFKNTERILVAYSILIVAIIYLIPDSILGVFIGSELDTFKRTLYFFLLTLPILSFCSTRGTLKLISFNYNKDFMKGILMSISVYAILIFGLIIAQSITIYNLILIIILSLMVELVSHFFHGKKINYIND